MHLFTSKPDDGDAATPWVPGSIYSVADMRTDLAGDRSTCAAFYVELTTDWNAQSQTDTITAFKVEIYNIEDGYNDRPCVGNTDQLLQMVEWPSFAHRWV